MDTLILSAVGILVVALVISLVLQKFLGRSVKEILSDWIAQLF